MPMRVEYPSFPGARSDDWVERLVQVLTFIRDFSPSQRAFRDWAATMGCWDKQLVPQIFDLYGVTIDAEDKYRLGEWPEKLLEAKTLDDQKEIVFRHLMSLNEYLTRFVFMRLKERVQGTEPLYRLVTSFAYHADKPTLPGFTAWVSW